MNLFSFIKTIFPTIENHSSKITEMKNIDEKSIGEIQEESNKFFRTMLDQTIFRKFKTKDWIDSDTGSGALVDITFFISKGKIKEIEYSFYTLNVDHFLSIEFDLKNYKIKIPTEFYDEKSPEVFIFDFEAKNAEDINPLSLALEFPYSSNVEKLKDTFDEYIRNLRLGGKIIIDIDWFLSNPLHREHLNPIKNINYKNLKKKEKLDLWMEYNRHCSEDSSIEEICDMIKLFQKESEIIIITGRDESQRESTLKWLADQRIEISKLIMTSNILPENILKFKVEELKKIQNVKFIFESDKDSSEYFRNSGYKVIHPNIDYLKNI